MQHSSRFRRFLAAGVALAAVTVLPALSSPAAATAATARPSYATDLPDLGTPQVAYDPRATQPAKGVAARGADGALLYSARSGTGFAALQSLGGVIVGDPSAVATPNGTDLFVRGTDDRVYTNSVTPGGAVTGYSVVPGVTVTGEVESVVPLNEPTGSVRIFARGQDGAVWTNIRRNGSWVGWNSLGGSITSDITAGRQILGARSVRIFVRGTDNRVYLNEVGPNDASGFQAVGDLRITSNIAIRDDHPFSALDIYARGEDNRVYARNLFGGTPTWQPLTGVSATSDITVTSQGFVYVRGGDNAIYSSRKDGSTFTFQPFERVEGEVAGNPAAFTLAQNGGPLTQYLLARRPDGTLALNIRPGFTGGPQAPFGGYTSIPGPAVS
ncbi:hypothetical protein [Actinomadura macra]|uniref:hypothetical protein n=1 Tax=Actinomadura macra TaxID=46164 RepID=UPI0008319284|nr:hypothetical protein [Actinomadura macra]